MTIKKELYKIVVKGRVQGVGFRQSCLQEARYRGINGYVENQKDGSVYIEAECEQEQVDALLKWFKHRGGYGSVDEIIVERGELKHHKSFIIRY